MRTSRCVIGGAALGTLLLTVAACGADDAANEDDTGSNETEANESGTSGSGANESGGSGDAADGEELAPGQHEFAAEIDGHDRTGVVLLPSGWTPDAELPLVVNLHGSGSDGAEQVLWSDATGTADTEGYVVVLPDGGFEDPDGGRLWNVPGVTDAPEDAPDDIAFLQALVEWSAEEYGTSTENVFATGYSGGGRMISQAACDDPNLFRAIAPVTGLRSGVPVEGEDGWVPDPATCEPDEVTPIVTFVGTDDPVNPVDGGGADYWQYGHEAALDRWAEIGGYEVREDAEQGDGVTLTTIGDGEGTDEIRSWSIDGAGHVWPGSPAFEEETDWAGTPTDAIDANELIWDFFEQFLGENPAADAGR